MGGYLCFRLLLVSHQVRSAAGVSEMGVDGH